MPAWICPDAQDREALLDSLLETRTPPLTERGTLPKSQYRHFFRSFRNPYYHFENEVGFHIESWAGLRLLSPYHDRRLVGMLNRISPTLLLHGTRYKGLLRPVVGKRLPGLGLEKQRKFQAPSDRAQKLEELRAGLAAVAPDASFAALDALGLIDGAKAVGEIGNLTDKNLPGLAGMFTLLCHDKWLQSHGTGSARRI